MSHFTVLVIGENVDQQLAPFHEFECTGRDDQYVQDIDVTAEVREEFESRKQTMLRDPEGGLHDPYEDRFYRDPTDAETAKIGPIAGFGGGHGISWSSKDWGDGRGYRTKVHFVPEGWQEVNVPTSEVESFAKFASGWHGVEIVHSRNEINKADEHKYGWCLVDDQGEVIEVINRTNPNKKWDWYQTGGRWTGFFQVKPGVHPEMYAAGDPGLMTDPARAGEADVLRIGDVDFEAMRATAAAKANETFDKLIHLAEDVAHLTVADVDAFVPWSEFDAATQVRIEPIKAQIEDEPSAALRESYRKRISDIWDETRDSFHAQPLVAAFETKEAREEIGFWWDDSPYEAYVNGRAAFVEDAVNGVGVPYAVVYQGQWLAKGEMGWWGMSRDEQDESAWRRKVRELYDSLPPETELTLVDCHI